MNHSACVHGRHRYANSGQHPHADTDEHGTVSIGELLTMVNMALGKTVRCSSQDPSCLQRAKKLGKKVEITD